MHKILADALPLFINNHRTNLRHQCVQKQITATLLKRKLKRWTNGWMSLRLLWPIKQLSCREIPKAWTTRQTQSCNTLFRHIDWIRWRRLLILKMSFKFFSGLLQRELVYLLTDLTPCGDAATLACLRRVNVGFWCQGKCRL